MPLRKQFSILLVEDEHNLHTTLKINLELEGYLVSSAYNGVEGLELAKRECFDLMIVDIMLPKMDGITLVETIKLNNISTAILILSARNTREEKVLGLKKGADDYITKPFDLEELLIRVEKLIKKTTLARQPNSIINNYIINGRNIDFKAYTIKLLNNQLVIISKKEAMLLQLLITNKNEVVSREKILQTIWGYNVYSTTRTIDNLILNFRKYFETDSKLPQYFYSVRGVGYKYVEAY